MVVTPIVVKMEYTSIYSQLRPNEEECDAVFLAPLSLFLKGGRAHSIFDLQHPSGKYRMHHFNVHSNADSVGVGGGAVADNFDVWGMTADILIYVASAVYGKRPQFAMTGEEDVAQLYPPATLFAPIKKTTSKL